MPDPSFPWFTLPPSLRLPVTQPRIEHWPVTYTVGIWLWVGFLPAVFLRGYRRYVRRGNHDPTTWLVALPTVAMVTLTTYCRLFWPKLYPPSWNAPSYTLVCWAYCSSYDPMWSNAAYVVAAFGAVTTVAAFQRWGRAPVLLGIFGVAAFPLGIPALVEARRRLSEGDSGSAGRSREPSAQEPSVQGR
ncbi:MAG: hypothetical protein ABEI99_05250 [Halobaculum sp.]